MKSLKVHTKVSQTLPLVMALRVAIHFAMTEQLLHLILGDKTRFILGG